MTLITKDTDYAIRALCYLARHPERPASVPEISKALKISYTFLRKILQILTKHEILRSVKGKGGGFSLNQAANKIFVNAIITIFQGPLDFKNCRVKQYICPDVKTCPLRKKVEEIENYARYVLQSVTIQSLIE